MIAENPLAPSPASTRILWLPGDSRHYDFDVGFGARRNVAGVRVDPETALQSTVVLACARVLAESVASLPLHLYRRIDDGGKAIARENPLYRLLHDQPNGWQTSFEWREQAMLHLCLHGNAYSEIRMGSGGVATELVPLHPSRMRVERVENGRLRYRYREENGRETVYTQEAIMHLRWLSDDGVNGMVPVELARDAIGLARACEIHGASFFGNGARPGVILTTEQMIAAEAAETLRNNWERMHRGPDRAQRTAVLTGGLKPIELGGNNQEAQFLEARRFQVEEICRLYRVPPHLVGDLTRSSFSNIEQQSIDFVQHTLLGWLRRFESAFTRDLIVDDATYFVEFDTRGLLRGDASARASYYSTMHQLGVLSLNEIRAAENLNPVDGGDIRVVPLNMQTLEQANAAAQAAMAPAAEPVVEEVVVDEPATPADAPTVLGVLDQYREGAITIEAAKALLQAAFPQTPEVMVDTILAGVVVPEPEPEPVAQEPVPEPVAPAPEPVAEEDPAEQTASKRTAKLSGRRLPVARRDCGTGAGGFKPGNKCAGGGDGGGTDSGGSGSGGGGEPDTRPYPERHAEAKQSLTAKVDAFIERNIYRDGEYTHAADMRQNLAFISDRMTPEAMARVNENLKGIGLFDTTAKLERAASAITERDMTGTLGAYEADTGYLRMNGGGASRDARGIFAHELAHAVDGPKYEISSSPEWKAAWAAEIKPGGISKYATTKESEGLAEFSRALWTGAISPRELRSEYPECWRVLKKYKVV